MNTDLEERLRESLGALMHLPPPAAEVFHARPGISQRRRAPGRRHIGRWVRPAVLVLATAGLTAAAVVGGRLITTRHDNNTPLPSGFVLGFTPAPLSTNLTPCASLPSDTIRRTAPGQLVGGGSLVMLDGLHGTLAGGSANANVFQVTDDGGKTWRQIIVPGGLQLADPTQPPVIQTDATHIYVVANDSLGSSGGTYSVYRSADDGASWCASKLPSPISLSTGSAPDVQIRFVSSTVGFVMGDVDTGRTSSSWVADIWQTADGGLTWRPLSQLHSTSPNNDCLRMLSLDWADASNGFATGCGTGIGLGVTHDAGLHWSNLALPVPQLTNECTLQLTPPQFFTASDGYLTAAAASHGFHPGRRGYLYVTHDGGSTWRIAELPATSLFQVSVVRSAPDGAVHFFALLGDGSIDTSIDDGAHWTVIARQSALAAQFSGQWWVNTSTGFFTAFTPNNSSTDLYVTSDGGRTLRIVTRGATALPTASPFPTP